MRVGEPSVEVTRGSAFAWRAMLAIHPSPNSHKGLHAQSQTNWIRHAIARLDNLRDPSISPTRQRSLQGTTRRPTDGWAAVVCMVIRVGHGLSAFSRGRPSSRGDGRSSGHAGVPDNAPLRDLHRAGSTKNLCRHQGACRLLEEVSPTETCKRRSHRLGSYRQVSDPGRNFRSPRRLCVPPSDRDHRVDQQDR